MQVPKAHTQGKGNETNQVNSKETKSKCPKPGLTSGGLRAREERVRGEGRI